MCNLFCYLAILILILSWSGMDPLSNQFSRIISIDTLQLTIMGKAGLSMKQRRHHLSSNSRAYWKAQPSVISYS